MSNPLSKFLTPPGVLLSTKPASYAERPEYEWTFTLTRYVREAIKYLADASDILYETSKATFVRLQSDKGSFDVFLSPCCYVTNGLTKIEFTTFGELVHALQISIAQRLEGRVDVTVAPYRWMPVEGEIPRSPAAIEVIDKCLKRFPVIIPATQTVIYGGYDDITGKRESAPQEVRANFRDMDLRVTFDGPSVNNTRYVILENRAPKYIPFKTEEELIAAIESATGMKPAPMGGAGGK
jgi:hypothetical protein